MSTPSAASLFGNKPAYSGLSVKGLANSPDSLVLIPVPALVAAATLSSAQTLGKMIVYTPTEAVAATTPTAAALIAALGGARKGMSFDLHIRNASAGAFAVALAAGAGVTVSGTPTVAQNNAKTFRFVVVNPAAGSEAITAYSLGTAVF